MTARHRDKLAAMSRAVFLSATLLLSTSLTACALEEPQDVSPLDADLEAAPLSEEPSELRAAANPISCPWFPHTEFHRMAPGDEMICPTWFFGTTTINLMNESGGTLLVNLQAGAWSQLVYVPRQATQPIVRIFAGLGVKISYLAPQGVVLKVRVY